MILPLSNNIFSLILTEFTSNGYLYQNIRIEKCEAVLLFFLRASWEGGRRGRSVRRETVGREAKHPIFTMWSGQEQLTDSTRLLIRWHFTPGVSKQRHLMPDGLSWSWCNNNRKKCAENVTRFNYPESVRFPTPILGKIWVQRGWGSLHYTMYLRKGVRNWGLGSMKEESKSWTVVTSQLGAGMEEAKRAPGTGGVHPWEAEDMFESLLEKSQGTDQDKRGGLVLKSRVIPQKPRALQFSLCNTSFTQLQGQFQHSYYSIKLKLHV